MHFPTANYTVEYKSTSLTPILLYCFVTLGIVNGNMLEEEQTINAVKQLTEQFEEVSTCETTAILAPNMFFH